MTDQWFCDQADEGARYGLLALMTGISEEFWCASWMSGLEFDCWRAVEDNGRDYGMGRITERQATLMRLLSEEADGWWHYPKEARDPKFIRLAEWKQKIAELRALQQEKKDNG